VLLTFVFVNVVLIVKNDRQNNQNPVLNALAFGFTLCGMSAIAVDISGACLNPAFGLVQCIFQETIFKYFWMSFDLKVPPPVELHNLTIFICAPLLGGVLAGFWQVFNNRAM
jgi:glycerol uptake facilitator-like aquaporin